MLRLRAAAVTLRYTYAILHMANPASRERRPQGGRLAMREKSCSHALHRTNDNKKAPALVHKSYSYA